MSAHRIKKQKKPSPSIPAPIPHGILHHMRPAPSLLDTLKRQGGQLCARVLTRDDLHLAPAAITRATAARLRSGIRAIEAYLRRVLLLMALQIEPGLKAARRARPVRHGPRLSTPQSHTFRALEKENAPPDWAALTLPRRTADALPRGTLIPSAPLLARLSVLKILIDAPDARARRLAWYLARRRPGPLLAPGTHRLAQLWGTEIGALYTAMAPQILRAGYARPPPLGPAPRPPPRIRLL